MMDDGDERNKSSASGSVLLSPVLSVGYRQPFGDSCTESPLHAASVPVTRGLVGCGTVPCQGGTPAPSATPGAGPSV